MIRRLSVSFSANIAENPAGNTSANIMHQNQVETNSDSEDDCIITDVSGSVFRPFDSTSDELVKRENDCISGDKPYIDTVSSFLLHTKFYLYLVLSGKNPHLFILYLLEKRSRLQNWNPSDRNRTRCH